MSWTSGVASLHQQAHVLFLYNKIKPDHVANRKGVELWGVVSKLSTSALTTSFATFFVCSSLIRFHIWYICVHQMMHQVCTMLNFWCIDDILVYWNNIFFFTKIAVDAHRSFFIVLTSLKFKMFSFKRKEHFSCKKILKLFLKTK